MEDKNIEQKMNIEANLNANLNSSINNQGFFQQQIQSNYQAPFFMNNMNINYNNNMNQNYNMNMNSNFFIQPNTFQVPTQNPLFIPNSNINNDLGIPVLVRIPQGDDMSLPIVSVIVTLYSGSSYDNLFRQVKQKAPEGRVSLFSSDLRTIDKLYKYLNGEEIPSNENSKAVVEELLKEIKELEPDCVLFNFECCSGCSDSGYKFPNSTATMQLMKLLLDRGHMIMCSDFAVMALINDWDPDYLNSNPFIKVGNCSTLIQLYFKPEVLVESPSAQLQVVGKLCSTGEAGINALGGTVVFSLDPKKVDSSVYELSILTIVTKAGGYNLSNCAYLNTIGEKNGTIGHAMVKYKSGGVLLLSAGHWISLSNLNIDCSNIENISSNLYGNQYQAQIESIKNDSTMNETQKNVQYNMMANMFVQQSAPCNYSKRVNQNFNNLNNN